MGWIQQSLMVLKTLKQSSTGTLLSWLLPALGQTKPGASSLGDRTPPKLGCPETWLITQLFSGLRRFSIQKRASGKRWVCISGMHRHWDVCWWGFRCCSETRAVCGFWCQDLALLSWWDTCLPNLPLEVAHLSPLLSSFLSCVYF